MKLGNLYDVEALARRRRILLDLRRHGTLTARLRTGTSLGSIDDDLTSELIGKLMPVIHTDLDARIAAVEADIHAHGVEID